MCCFCILTVSGFLCVLFHRCLSRANAGAGHGHFDSNQLSFRVCAAALRVSLLVVSPLALLTVASLLVQHFESGLRDVFGAWLARTTLDRSTVSVEDSGRCGKKRNRPRQEASS